MVPSSAAAKWSHWQMKEALKHLAWKNLRRWNKGRWNQRNINNTTCSLCRTITTHQTFRGKLIKRSWKMLMKAQKSFPSARRLKNSLKLRFQRRRWHSNASSRIPIWLQLFSSFPDRRTMHTASAFTVERKKTFPRLQKICTANMLIPISAVSWFFGMFAYLNSCKFRCTYIKCFFAQIQTHTQNTWIAIDGNSVIGIEPSGKIYFGNFD